MRFLSYLVRPGVFLILGLAVGYCYGYSDAFSESETIGAKVRRAIGKVEPDEVRAERIRRASILRDTIQVRAGVGLPPN
jgi:hypothetical protein